MKTKKLITLLTVMSMAVSMVACGKSASDEAAAPEQQAQAQPEQSSEALAGDWNNDGQIDMGIEGLDVEVNETVQEVLSALEKELGATLR